MATFDEREKGFEAKFKLDQETQFKITARRNRLLGQWAAQKLGLAGPAAESYAKEVVASDFEKAGDQDVVDKVRRDLEAKGVALGLTTVRAELDRCAATARDQVMAERNKA